MDDPPRSRAASVVVAALGDESLDPAVRDLAVERLEALLLAAVRAVPEAAGVATVTLSAADGGVALAPPPALSAAGAAALAERVDRALLTHLASTVGAARLAVRAGERAAARASAPPAPPPRWEDVVAALAGVVAAQRRALEALARKLDAPLPDDDGAAAEVRRVEAMVERLRRG